MQNQVTNVGQRTRLELIYFHTLGYRRESNVHRKTELQNWKSYTIISVLHNHLCSTLDLAQHPAVWLHLKLLVEARLSSQVSLKDLTLALPEHLAL